MKNIIASTLALAALAAADSSVSTSKNSNGRTVIPYVAKFDDAQAGLLANLPVRGVTPLGPYKNLYYTDMGVIADDTLALGLDAVSKPNTLGYDVVAELEGKQNITSRYQDSITDYFNLRSFYFGCVIDSQETATSVPADCTIKITGFRNGDEVASQTESFKDNGFDSHMFFVQLGPGFDNVDTVAFKTTGLLGKTLNAVLFDNIAYDVTLKQGH